MVEKFLQLKESLKESGMLTLFVLAKMDNITDKWTVILAAPWINESTRNEIFFKLWQFMKTTLDENERVQIDKVGVFNSSEPFVKKFDFALTQLSQNRDPYTPTLIPYREFNFTVNGNFINEAIILEWTQMNPLNI